VGTVPFWRIVYTDDYLESRDDLDHSEDTRAAVRELEFRVGSEPKAVEPFPGCLQIRVNKGDSEDGYTPLRLYYWIERRTIYFARVERYDDKR